MSKINKIKLSGTTYDIQDLSATSVVNVTQAQYEAMVTGGTVDPTTLYNITDAQAGDLSQYWTSAQTNSAITEAVSGKADTSYVDQSVSGKQDTLSAGTGIEISGNVISATGGGGGGGKAIEAGRGISVTTGETADTVSFNLPISAGTGTGALVIASDTYNLSNKATGNYAVSIGGGGGFTNKAIGTNSLAEGVYTIARGSASHAEGYATSAGTFSFPFTMYDHAEGSYTHAAGGNSHAEGEYTIARGPASHAEGYYTIAQNYYEHASGRYNVSTSASTAWGDSGNTLFSVGNGTAENARHNAFEIRQNGDIYITSGGTDIKLQDNLGSGGGGSITIDPSLDSGSTNPVANSAITNVLSNYYYARKSNNSKYNSPWGTMNSNGCVGFTLGFANILNPNDSVSSGVWISKINNKDLIYTNIDTPNANYFNLNLVETSAITTSISSSSTDAQVPSAKAVNDKLGGLSIVKLTQSEYDAIATKDNSTLYVIVN